MACAVYSTLNGLERVICGGKTQEWDFDEVKFVVQASITVVVLHVTEPKLDRREPRVELTDCFTLSDGDTEREREYFRAIQYNRFIVVSIHKALTTLISYYIYTCITWSKSQE